MLLNYIPEFLRGIDELKKLFSALDFEILQVYNAVQDIFDGQFIYLCGLPYIERFEKILGIEGFDEKDLSKRRKKIIMKFNEKLPYTVFRFKESLNFICGDKNYFLFIAFERYRIIVKVPAFDKDVFDEVSSLCERMIPVNMEVFVSGFNTHEILGKFKHKDLAHYTQRELRSVIISF